MHDGIAVFVTKSFESDFEFDGHVAVDADELVMLEADDVAFLACDDVGDALELTGPVGQEHGKSEDAAAVDQAVLDQRSHGDDVHVATGQNRDHTLPLEA